MEDDKILEKENKTISYSGKYMILTRVQYYKYKNDDEETEEVITKDKIRNPDYTVVKPALTNYSKDIYEGYTKEKIPAKEETNDAAKKLKGYGKIPDIDALLYIANQKGIKGGNSPLTKMEMAALVGANESTIRSKFKKRGITDKDGWKILGGVLETLKKKAT